MNPHRAPLLLIVAATGLAALMGGASSAAAEPAVAQAAPTGRIAFSSNRDGNYEIYVMNADGSAQTRLTTTDAYTYDDDAKWSPDGEKIAYTRAFLGLLGDIYVMNADGTGQTRLTNNVVPDHVPTWSPDGQKIAFHSTRDGNADIYVMNADGTGQTRLTNDDALDLRPDWSPDGQKIAFMSGIFTFDIYVMNADGSGRTRLTNTYPAGDAHPAWSPDGQKIAFTSYRDAGNQDIYVMNADGSGLNRLTNNPMADFRPAWSPDGQKIAFTSNRDDGSGLNYEIYVMNADGSEQTRVTNHSAADTSPAWQPAQQPVSFEWTVPARFGGDADEGGVIDYFEPDGSLEIHPDGFRVDFTTDTPLSCDTTLSRTWSIDGQEVTADDPRIVFYDPNDCRFSYLFEDEGTYEVEVEVERADGLLLGFETHEVVVQDFLIVSLGDSVASGEGNPDLPQSGGPERWQNQQCHRSALAGPAQAAIQLEQADEKTSVTFVHLACSGATIEEGVLGPYEGIESGALLPPQVEQMRDLVGEREIDALLVSIGANDVQFSTLIERCFLYRSCHLLVPGSAASLFERLIARLPGRYDRLDAALQPPEVPSERVYISEYFDPTRNGTGGSCDGILADHPAGGGPFFGITAEEAQWASENMLVRLNADVLGAAARHGWRYAGGITSRFLTHGYCAPLNWVLTYTESMLVQGDQNGTIHPNGPGHLAYGDGLAAGLWADLYEGGDLDRPRPPE